jgi:hypothetical protein
MNKNFTIPKNLLSKGTSNTKTAKSSLKTYILYLAPYNQNSKGINICPKASKGCAAACLFTAGRGRFDSVKNSRINRTEYFLHDKERFCLQLAGELIKINKAAKKSGEQVAIRLNGTSDLDFIYLLKKYAKLDPFTLDQLIYYDYTKILGKVKKYIDETRYILTFSRAEDNHEEALKALELGANISAVFSGDLPEYYKGAKVIDGEQSDIVMIYNKGAVLGLKAKGAAKKDTSGFVLHTETETAFTFDEEGQTVIASETFVTNDN